MYCEERNVMKKAFGKVKYWFVNVFWYHYKWVPLVVLVIIGIIFVLTSDLFKGMDPDYEVVLTSCLYVTDEQMLEVTNTMSELVGDRNEDGYEYSPIVVMNMTGGELEQNNTIKLAAYMAAGDVVLYLMDEVTVDNYLAQDLFEPVSTFGFEADEEDPCLIRIDQYPVFDRAGLATFAERLDTRYYACFLKITDEMRSDPEIMERYDTGVEILQSLMEME